MARARRPARGDSVFRTVDVVGDAWSWLILREAIFHGVQRFNEFRARLGVARETLVARLDQLTAGGLLERRPRTGGAFSEYILTDSGRDFFICLAAAQRWGDRWRASRGARAMKLRHLGCGARFEAVLRCSACREPLQAREVSVTARSPIRAERRRRERTRQPGLHLLERERECSIARTLQVIGDRWSSLVIRESFLRARRFGDYLEHLGIAPNILAVRLTRLERLGILERRARADRADRHEYRLTAKGLDLYPVPLAMLTWGDRWLAQRRPALVLAHRKCGKRFTALLTCARCRETAGAEDVSLVAARSQIAERGRAATRAAGRR